jgi:hypothetical protein
VFLDSGQLNEFEVTLMRLTALSDLAHVIAPGFVGDQQRGRVEDGLRVIDEVVKRPSEKPTLALFHLPWPHAPILYDDAGRPRAVDARHPYEYDLGGRLEREEQLGQYREQLDYVNRRVLSSLDGALAKPGPEPIVVVWSDHGSLIDLDTDVHLRLRERVSNLFAARTPGHKQLFGDAPTLVNTFPTLLHAYLGIDVPRAADRSFVSAQASLFQFTEVTDDDGSRR